ncbi:hypothetical protein ABGB09_33210 [Streptomyces sp. B8F3]|uniref:hypothetical protein n=1 Tax=Streptomyces sp. B8F3 TaxID=3153573 RepID=UPI00325E05FF
MSPRALSAAALAATAALSLLLTACGSDEEDDATKPDDKIQGAEKGEDDSPSPSAEEEAAGRPEIELPEDLKITFSPEETGDPVKDAVLRDNAERMKAIQSAIAGLDPKYEALNYYNTDEALAESAEWVEQFKEEKLTVTGAVRYSDRQVTLNADGTATLTFCADESKGYSKSLETGKVNVTPITKDSYLVYNTKLQKDDQGVWRTTSIFSERGAVQCQP